MKRTGIFRELDGLETAPSMHDSLQSTPASQESAMVAYLNDGVLVVDVMEVSRDVIDGQKLQVSASLRTDGVWYWREDLGHYVAKYHLQLEQEFISHVEANEFVRPPMGLRELERAAREVVADWSGR